MACWKEKRKVMQRYDLTADMYEERYAEEQKAKYRKALEKVSLESGSVVLDVGCGSGLFFNHVAAKVGMVVGVDVSRKLLVKAKEQAKGFANVFLVQADADHLPLCSEVFDVVFGFTVLQNMPKPKETIGELKRVTKTGGGLVITGLKKAFSLFSFLEVVEAAGLRVDSFADDEVLKCYVAVTAKS